MTNPTQILVRGQALHAFDRSSRRVLVYTGEERYALVAVRPEPVQAGPNSHYVAFAEVKRTSATLKGARPTATEKANAGPGCEMVVVNLATGNEIKA